MTRKSGQVSSMVSVHVDVSSVDVDAVSVRDDASAMGCANKIGNTHGGRAAASRISFNCALMRILYCTGCTLGLRCNA